MPGLRAWDVFDMASFKLPEGAFEPLFKNFLKKFEKTLDFFSKEW